MTRSSEAHRRPRALPTAHTPGRRRSQKPANRQKARTAAAGLCCLPASPFSRWKMVGGDGLEVLTGGGIRLSSAGSGPLAAGSVNPWAAAAGLALVCPGDGGRRGIGNWGQAPSARASLSSMAWRAKRRWLPATGAPEVGLLGSDSLGLIRPAMAVGSQGGLPAPPRRRSKRRHRRSHRRPARPVGRSRAIGTSSSCVAVRSPYRASALSKRR
jgi:hypothetical protein